VRNYIGLATSPHDGAIAIVNDRGEIVFAEASERYLQNKRAWGYSPDDWGRTAELIHEFCPKDTEVVLASSWERPNTFISWANDRLTAPFRVKRKLPKDTFNFMLHVAPIAYGLNRYVGGAAARYLLNIMNGQRAVSHRRFNHHLTHAAAACFTSPFEEAVCAVVDGAGDRLVSTSFYHYKNAKLVPVPGIQSTRYVSLGNFFSLLCSACGFDALKGEEWKVMGLAAYGSLNEALYSTLRTCIDVKGCQLVASSDGNAIMDKIVGEGHKYFGKPLAAADLAFAGQMVFSDVMTELLANVHRCGISDNLIVAGGCGLNSAFNGQILERTPFRNLHVYCAPADDGNAVGAALCAYREDHPDKRPLENQGSPYLGSVISQRSLSNLQEFGGLKPVSLQGTTLIQRTAELIAAGKIVGWVQGRAEFGPRALGNRSILADPRTTDVKNRMNATIKFREEFRPFAPAILHECGDEYFLNYQESRYMERALRFRPEAACKVPGVVHVDGTGRLQTVKRDWNAKYYELIAAFYRMTGIPILLNTSFNVMGKPIIHTVEDAVAVFCTSGMDVLVLEDQIYQKT